MSMATLPSVDGRTKAAKQAEPVQQTGQDKTEPAKPYEGYLSRNVDVRRMTKRQAEVLHAKLRHLQDIGAKTADGQFVVNKSQAIRWILENEVKLG